MESDAYLQMAQAEAGHWWFRGRRKILGGCLRRLNLPGGARILELGSGTGGNFAMLAGFGRVTAVELNAAARAISLTRSPAVRDVRPGALPDDGPLAAQVFDLVCMFDVLEHVAEDEATLALIRRHLALGGRAMLTVPAFRFLWGPHDVMLHHKRRYEKSELREKLEQAGLAVEKLTYFNMVLFPAALLARLLDRLLRRKTASGEGTPPVPLNALFAFLFGAERHLLAFTNLPVGLSLLAIVKAAPEIARSR